MLTPMLTEEGEKHFKPMRKAWAKTGLGFQSANARFGLPVAIATGPPTNSTRRSINPPSAPEIRRRLQLCRSRRGPPPRSWRRRKSVPLPPNSGHWIGASLWGFASL
ncbi:hypothetical protein NL676_036287 [Syzygium grande]|nr:hypothetical protein NL676_036287 [Syzygium grande]